jgi:rhamnan synthesis protein F
MFPIKAKARKSRLARNAMGLAAFLPFAPVRRRYEQLTQSGLFDSVWYRLNNLDSFEPEPSWPFDRRMDPAWHHVSVGRLLDPNPLFDAEWYVAKRPEAASRGNVPLLHYLARGAAEGLDPNPDFSSADYFRRYPDAQASGLSALEHYMLRGAREGRDPRHAPAAQPSYSQDRSGNLRLVCLFSHFDAAGRILPYVQRYLSELSRCGFEIHLVSTSPNLSASDRRKVEREGVRVHCRENIGLDFASWQWALNHVVQLAEVDWLLLANDSVFGPIFDLEPLFRSQFAEKADFWGITDSHDVAWHLQSYFLCLRGDVARSEAFRDVFAVDFAGLTKQEIIRDGEISLSQSLLHSGFRGSAVCRFDRLRISGDHGQCNPTHFYWDQLIARLGCPFIKRELIRDNPMKLASAGYWKGFLERYTSYDTSLISDAILPVENIPAS